MMIRQHLAGVALLAGIAVISAPALPQESPWAPRVIAQAAAEVPMPAGKLRLRDAVAAMLANHPRLMGQRYERDIGFARRGQAALDTPFEVGLEAENILGTGPYRGLSGMETTLQLSKIIELGDKRGRRVAVADRELELLEIEQRVQQLDLVAETARRFIDVLVAQETLSLAAQNAEIWKRTSGAIKDRGAAAKISPAEELKAEIAYTRAEMRREEAEHDLLSARTALSVLWGSREPRFEAAVGELYTMPEPAGLKSLAAEIDRNPDIARFMTERRLQETKLRLAEAGRRQDLRISAGARRFEDGNDSAFLLSLSVPLGSVSRSQWAEREAKGRLDQVNSREEVARLEIYNTLFALYQEVGHARHVAETLRTRVLPKASRALNLTSNGFQAGRFSYLELVDAQDRLAEIRREALGAASDYHKLMVDMERLIGRAGTLEDMQGR